MLTMIVFLNERRKLLRREEEPLLSVEQDTHSHADSDIVASMGSPFKERLMCLYIS
jgi:hypothetical protein